MVEMVNPESLDLVDLKETQVQKELQEKMVTMEQLENLVSLGVPVLRENVVRLESLVPQENRVNQVFRDRKEKLDRLVSKEKREAVDWMAVRESLVNEVLRVTKDLKA